MLVERFCKEADRKQKLEVIEDALSGLESFIDYRAWAMTYHPEKAKEKPEIKAEDIDPAKIDRLTRMKPVPAEKQAEILKKLQQIKQGTEGGK